MVVSIIYLEENLKTSLSKKCLTQDGSAISSMTRDQTVTGMTNWLCEGASRHCNKTPELISQGS